MIGSNGGVDETCNRAAIMSSLMSTVIDLQLIREESHLVNSIILNPIRDETGMTEDQKIDSDPSVGPAKRFFVDIDPGSIPRYHSLPEYSQEEDDDGNNFFPKRLGISHGDYNGGALFIRSQSPGKEIAGTAKPAGHSSPGKSGASMDFNMLSDSGEFQVIFSITSASRIGKGRISEVYDCRILNRLGIERDVVVKLFKAEDEALAEKELNALTSLRGIPGVVQLFGSISDCDPDSNIFSKGLILEKASGGSLSDILFGRHGDLFSELVVPPTTFVNWTRQIFAALAEIHDRGLIHWDLKPHNILLKTTMIEGGETELILADFGSATPDLSIHPAIGTMAYTPPEVLEITERVAYTPAVDIYSAGVTLYSMLTRRSPFAKFESGGVNLILAIRAGFFRGHHNQIDSIPVALLPLLSVCEVCVQVEPTRRPTAKQVLQILNNMSL